MAQKNTEIQKYAPEIQTATNDIIRQLPADINTLALQAKIAEAIVQRSEAQILSAVNEALAYRPSPPPAPTRSENNVKIDAININIDNSQNINYWQDNSQTFTDNSSRNYWADNRRYEDNFTNTDNSSHSSVEIFGFDLANIGLIGLILMALVVAFSQPCTQQFQQQQRQQQQELQGGTAL